MIKEIFKFLDGKIGRVSCGNLHSEGSIEGSVMFSYKEYFGLHLLAKLKWNSEFGNIWTNIGNNREIHNLGYDLKGELSNQLIQIGKVSNYKIKACKTYYENENLIRVEIFYENGSVTEIRVSSENYNEHQKTHLKDFI
jgi:S-adenosylmethionine hydrolase